MNPVKASIQCLRNSAFNFIQFFTEPLLNSTHFCITCARRSVTVTNARLKSLQGLFNLFVLSEKPVTRDPKLTVVSVGLQPCLGRSYQLYSWVPSMQQKAKLSSVFTFVAKSLFGLVNKFRSQSIITSRSFGGIKCSPSSLVSSGSGLLSLLWRCYRFNSKSARRQLRW